MRRREFRYKSSDGITWIRGIEWIPDGRVHAVLQICHGMTEHIARYEEFATYLTGKGFYVVGNDHLGHGKSVRSDEYHGFFQEERGNECVLGDIHKLRWWAQKRHPGLPYFMLGHSMGSFLLRQYLAQHSGGLDGAIIMGTGYHGLMELRFGKLLCRSTAALRGWKYRSLLVNAMAFGSFNRKFRPCETRKDWLTKDKAKRDEYIADPLCNFVFTVNGYYHMFDGMSRLEKSERAGQIPVSLPILFVSGENDPVGNFGKGVRKVYERYQKAGCTDVELKLYREDRHEILNETDRTLVYEDLWLWLEERIEGI